MHIVYVSDGKAGHRSQALGLYQAMQRQSVVDVTFQEIPLQELSLLDLFSALFSHQLDGITPTPTFIFGVGSHTHLRVWLLGKIFPTAKTVILMKPSLPIACFDYAVIPEHDGIPASDHVIVTKGALNPIVNEQRHIPNQILIALGGNSKRHQWNDQKVLQVLEKIIVNNPDAEIILTTSRRTPAEFLPLLSQQDYAKKIQIFPVEQTPQGWIFEQMQQAEAVWVTEDSISMIYEALTAGCKVGVIELDRLKQDRIIRSIQELMQREDISLNTRQKELKSPATFKEAERVATYLLSQK